MKKHTSLILAAAVSLSVILPYAAHAQVPLDCSGDNCGTVQIPSSGQPPASDAGSAPGHPIEAPSTPVRDPIAPVEPPSPGQ